MENIDLSTARPGDKLISSLGGVLEYVSTTPWRQYTYLDHVVKYITIPGDRTVLGGSEYGTRTNDGFVFAHNRIPATDHDIIRIIRK